MSKIRCWTCKQLDNVPEEESTWEQCGQCGKFFDSRCLPACLELEKEECGCCILEEV